MLVPQKPLKSRIPLLLCDLPAVNITIISTIAFHFNIYRKDNKVFTISLYKINRIINKREKELTKETNKKFIKRLFFTIYIRHKGAFLKTVLDKLPPYQIYNYKI